MSGNAVFDGNIFAATANNSGLVGENATIGLKSK